MSNNPQPTSLASRYSWIVPAFPKASPLFFVLVPIVSNNNCLTKKGHCTHLQCFAPARCSLCGAWRCCCCASSACLCALGAAFRCALCALGAALLVSACWALRCLSLRVGRGRCVSVRPLRIGRGAACLCVLGVGALCVLGVALLVSAVRGAACAPSACLCVLCWACGAPSACLCGALCLSGAG